jgi:hypothetical protein
MTQKSGTGIRGYELDLIANSSFHLSYELS